MSCGNSRSFKCNPCGPSADAMNAIADRTIPVGINAGSFGPITVASGAIVTVPSGGVWTVV